MKTTVKECLNKESRTDCSTTPLSSAISEHSLIQDVQSFTGELRMLYREDFPVNRFQLQGNEKQTKTREICGLPLCELSKLPDQNTSFWKTCQGLFHVDISETFFKDFTKSGMMRNGKLYQRKRLGPDIKENDCGLFPTPVAYDATPGGPNNHYKGLGYIARHNKNWLIPSTITIEGGEDRIKKRTEYRKSIGRKYVAGCLAEQVHFDSEIPKTDTWPTPMNALVKMYPTPTNSMVTTGDLEHARFHSSKRPKYQSVNTGQLNPDWVEWLMGWPIGWSDLKPIEEMVWLDLGVDPADTGEIGRVTTKKENRINRLKAIGNGQVPQCAATAWNILTEGLNKPKTR